jgi:regulator of sirC expression with transglutaminase-like and TPR domain
MSLSRKFQVRSVHASSSLLACLLVAVASISSLPAAAKNSTLLNTLLQTEAAHQGLCSYMLDETAARAEIGRLAEEVRKQLPNPPIPSGTVEAINQIVFGPTGIRPSQELHDPCNLFLSSVLAEKRGYCVGVAGVYLVLAEELGLPIRAVATPSHVFLRYDDGEVSINIDPLSQGAAIPDQQYITQHRIAEKSIRKGVFLRALTNQQFLAQMHSNIGVVYSERRDYVAADAEYAVALKLDRRLPSAWYNRGKNDMEQQEFAAAARWFSKALRLHPNDTWALNNRGLAYQKVGKAAAARVDFEAALRIDPAFEPAKRSLIPR